MIKRTYVILIPLILFSCSYKNNQTIVIKGDEVGKFLFSEFSNRLGKGLIRFKPTGAQLGILSLVDNVSDVVFSLKKLSNEDYALLNSKNIYVEAIPIITTKIAFIVNTANPIDSLKLWEIKRIFNGFYKYWWQVGSPNYRRFARKSPSLSQIKYCSLDRRNGEYYVVKNRLGIFDFYMETKFFPTSQVLKKYIINSVGSIGYLPVSFLTQKTEKPSVKIVNQDIEATGYLIVKKSLYKTNFFFNFFKSFKSYLLENKLLLLKKGIKVIIQNYNYQVTTSPPKKY